MIGKGVRVIKFLRYKSYGLGLLGYLKLGEEAAVKLQIFLINLSHLTIVTIAQ